MSVVTALEMTRRGSGELKNPGALASGWGQKIPLLALCAAATGIYLAGLAILDISSAKIVSGIGAVLYTFFVVAISSVTKAWLLYLGLFFMAMVLFAPGGVASIAVANLRVAQAGLFGRLAPAYGAALGAGLAALGGFAVIVEMLYHRELEAVNDPVLKLLGLKLNVTTAPPWLGAVAVLAAGLAALWLVSRRVRARWDEVHERLGKGRA